MVIKINIGKCKVMSYSMREHIQTQYFIYDDNNEHYLENLNINDLGVIFDSRLSFREHIQEKIEKAYKMLGIIKRNFDLSRHTASTTSSVVSGMNCR